MTKNGWLRGVAILAGFAFVLVLRGAHVRQYLALGFVAAFVIGALGAGFDFRRRKAEGKQAPKE
jgi:hypothetical protein